MTILRLIVMSSLIISISSQECNKEFLEALAADRIKQYNTMAKAWNAERYDKKNSCHSSNIRPLLSSIAENTPCVFNDSIKIVAPLWQFPTGNNNTINLSNARLSNTKNLIAFCKYTKTYPYNIKTINVSNNNIEGTIDIKELCKLFTNLKFIDLCGNQPKELVLPDDLDHELVIYISDDPSKHSASTMANNIVFKQR